MIMCTFILHVFKYIQLIVETLRRILTEEMQYLIIISVFNT